MQRHMCGALFTGDETLGHIAAATISEHQRNKEYRSNHRQRKPKPVQQSAARLLRKPVDSGQCSIMDVVQFDLGITFRPDRLTGAHCRGLQQKALRDGGEKGLIDRKGRDDDRRSIRKRPIPTKVRPDQRGHDDIWLTMDHGETSRLYPLGEKFSCRTHCGQPASPHLGAPDVRDQFAKIGIEGGEAGRARLLALDRREDRAVVAIHGENALESASVGHVNAEIVERPVRLNPMIEIAHRFVPDDNRPHRRGKLLETRPNTFLDNLLFSYLRRGVELLNEEQGEG